MRKFTFPHRTSFIALAILLVGVLTFSSADALFKRMPVFQAIQRVVLSNIYKLHKFVANDDYAEYGSFVVTFPEELMLSNQDYAIQCNPTGESEASSVWYDFRRRDAEDNPEISLELELNTIYTCQGMIRTNHGGNKRLYTHHGSEFQTMICHEDAADTAFGDTRTKCEKGAKTAAAGDNRYVSFRAGYVPQHAESGWWKTDPDGVILSAGNFNTYTERLAYCKKFWSDTVLIIDPANPNAYRDWFQEININPPTVFERLDNWYGVNNLRRPSSMNVQTYECEATWYHWEYDAWGACQCDGNKYRNVECLNNLDVAVSDSLCDSSTEPARMESCTIPNSCYNWNETGYGSCQCDTYKYMSHNCRNFGMDQLLGTTPVAGVPTITGSVPTIVDDSVCLAITAEPTTRAGCAWGDMPNGCFTWHHTGYEACQCDGTKTRIYECKNDSTDTVVDDALCSGTKPSGSDSCTIPSSCYSWIDKGFGACSCFGSQSKSYVCENSQYANVAVSEYFCSHTTKPVTTQNCATPSSCYGWVFGNSYETCTCVPQRKKRIYDCRNTTTNSVVADASCDSAGAEPVIYSTCTQSELPASCFSDGDDWNAAASCSSGCYLTNYTTYGAKKSSSASCLGTGGRPVNSCNNAKQCCSDANCLTDYVCNASGSCQLRACTAGDWYAAASCSSCYTSNYSTIGTKKPTANCVGGVGAPTRSCGSAVECCSSSDCATNYVCSSNSCILRTCVASDWNVAPACDSCYTAGYFTTGSKKATSTCQGGTPPTRSCSAPKACCLNSDCPTDYNCSANSCVMRACTAADWNSPTCLFCYTNPYPAVGTKKSGVNCTGTTGRPTLSCDSARSCCMDWDCDPMEQCFRGTCIPNDFQRPDER